MPHKQNLVSLELIRAKCGKAIGWLSSAFSIPRWEKVTSSLFRS
ncbi:MAG TPA: hypothetical protein EYP03_03280 [Aquificae bacterium]|nr:hypothetical protein [Aquificota bacterium]